MFTRGVFKKHKEMHKNYPPGRINSFSYKDKVVIDSLNFVFKRGGKYIIKGAFGSGKSTLINLIMGLSKPTTGKILWNNVSVDSFDPKLLLNYVHVVSTDELILDATLRNNITMFNDSISAAKIDSTVKLLGLSDLDLETYVSAERVSAGEKQRILLARAIIEPREVLILDEVLSNLDETNRVRIENYFLANPSLTLIHITHHLKNTELYGEILNLDRGVVDD